MTRVRFIQVGLDHMGKGWIQTILRSGIAEYAAWVDMTTICVWSMTAVGRRSKATPPPMAGTGASNVNGVSSSAAKMSSMSPQPVKNYTKYR